MQSVSAHPSGASPSTGFAKFGAALMSAWRQWCLREARRREFEQLDSGALRDLGLCRSEYLSYYVEANSNRVGTRRRVVSMERAAPPKV